MIDDAKRFVGWSVMNTDNPDSCFGTFEREQSAHECAENLRRYGNHVRVEEAYVPDVFANQEAELLRLRAVVEAARGVLDVRPFGSWEPQWDTLRATLDVLDEQS